MNNTVAVDFDGVIHAWDGVWDDFKPACGIVAGAPEALLLLMQSFDRVIIYTARYCCCDNPEAVRGSVEQWLRDYEMLPGKHYTSVTGCKPIAKFYIDDNAVRFLNWPDTLRFIKENLCSQL